MDCRLTLERTFKGDSYTIGKLSINGKAFCDILEDVDRGLTNTMPVSVIKSKKISGKTAIPLGTYEILLTGSPRFSNTTWGKRYGGLVPLLNDVRGFSGVRIHPGNKPEDTEGCLLPGINSVKGRVTSSVIWYCKLMDILKRESKAGKRIYIEIK